MQPPPLLDALNTGWLPYNQSSSPQHSVPAAQHGGRKPWSMLILALVFRAGGLSLCGGIYLHCSPVRTHQVFTRTVPVCTAVFMCVHTCACENIVVTPCAYMCSKGRVIALLPEGLLVCLFVCLFVCLKSGGVECLGMRPVGGQHAT